MHYGGGLIIRQFLPMRIKRKLPDGKEKWLPEKCLYGIILINNNWSGISAKELQIACETDSNTGKQLPHEARVHYKDFDM